MVRMASGWQGRQPQGIVATRAYEAEGGRQPQGIVATRASQAEGGRQPQGIVATRVKLIDHKWR